MCVLNYFTAKALIAVSFPIAYFNHFSTLLLCFTNFLHLIRLVKKSLYGFEIFIECYVNENLFAWYIDAKKCFTIRRDCGRLSIACLSTIISGLALGIF